MSDQLNPDKTSGPRLTPPFRTRTLVPGFVGEITCIRLDRPLSGMTVEALKAAWTEHPVIVFPDQPFALAELEAFAGQFGEFGVDPYIRPVDQTAHVVEVRREAHETTPIFGASWHSDWSFQAAPPSATLLHAKIVPPVGGDTFFADCAHAYAALTPEMRSRLEGLQAVHTAAPSYGPRGLFAKDDASRSMRIVVSPDAEQSETHPIVRTHPASGRQGLFINHVYTVAIAGMDTSSSRALLDELFTHMTRRDFVYRHEWQSDMLVVWDNRAVVHHAAGGYAGYQRLMHRVTLAGERPR